MPIIMLDLKTSNQIAAGEVIENPASVVKELAENSLDAGAKRIKVTLKKGGAREITVLDDGCGIKPSEMRLSLERHATSKIRHIEDLDQISTLGFRGEALPSIASVSKMKVISRHTEEETGIQIALEGGQEKEFKEVGFHRGTKVTVEDLFYNTPARQKFLKGTAAETARVSRTLQLMALSRPDVSFSLERESGPLLNTPGDGSLYNVLFQIYGKDLCRHLGLLEYENEGLSLFGFATDPSFTLRSRNYQAYYVNGRYVRSRLFREVLDKSFARVVTSRRYPAAFLFLGIDPAEMDVNVHPTKIEVRFRREAGVRDFLENALSNFFENQFSIPGWKSGSAPEVKDDVNQKPGGASAGTEKLQESSSYRQQFIRKLPPRVFEPDFQAAGEAAEAERADKKKRSAEGVPHRNLSAPPSDEISAFESGGRISQKLLGQAFGTYIICQEEEHIYFVDQHAAHERILWEKYLEGNRNPSPAFRQEIIPLTLELPLQVSEAMEDRLEMLEKIGLEVEQFGTHTFVVRSVPFFLKGSFSSHMFLDVFEQVADRRLTAEDFLREAVLQLICKASVKAGQILTNEEMHRLLNDLEQCHNLYYCPHGRPTMFKMARGEMEKYFKRQG